MNKFNFWGVFFSSVFLITACKKDNNAGNYVYYQVGFDTENADWRDTAFVIRTKDQGLIQKADEQLNLPMAERKIVFGGLASGNGDYNKNAAHSFKWHFKEDDWDLIDITAEIYDGKPFTDIDGDTAYWLNTVKRFGAWSSYIKRKLPDKP